MVFNSYAIWSHTKSAKKRWAKWGCQDLVWLEISTIYLGFHYICHFLLAFHQRLQHSSHTTHLDAKKQLDHLRYWLLERWKSTTIRLLIIVAVNRSVESENPKSIKCTEELSFLDSDSQLISDSGIRFWEMEFQSLLLFYKDNSN